jgi:hypothetical protein
MGSGQKGKRRDRGVLPEEKSGPVPSQPLARPSYALGAHWVSQKGVGFGYEKPSKTRLSAMPFAVPKGLAFETV